MAEPQLTRLHWKHPDIGDIGEVVCPAHSDQVRAALSVLGIGSLSDDGSLPAVGYGGPGELPLCLRCQAPPSMPARIMLRQWFGDDRG